MNKKAIVYRDRDIIRATPVGDTDHSFTIETFNVDHEIDENFNRAFELLGFDECSTHPNNLYIYPHSRRFRASKPQFTGPGIYAFQEVSVAKLSALCARVGYPFNKENPPAYGLFNNPYNDKDNNTSGFSFVRQAAWSNGGIAGNPFVVNYTTYNMVLWGPEFHCRQQTSPSYFADFNIKKNFGSKLNIRTTFFNEIIYKKTNKSIWITSVHFQVPKNPSGTNKGEQTFLSLLEDAKNLGNFVIIGDYNLKHPEFITLYNNNKDTIAEFGYSKKQTNFKAAHKNEKNQLVNVFYERLDYGVFSKNIKINEERIHDNMKIDLKTGQLMPGSSDHAKVSYKITIE